jgi:hypothetical protein
MSNPRQERTGYYAPSYKVAYAGYTIKTVEHHTGFLIDGHKVHHGYVACDENGFTNVMPAATWFLTVEDAKEAIDDLIATNLNQGRPAGIGDARTADHPDFDSHEFWSRVRARKAAKSNAVRMAVLLMKLKEEGTDLPGRYFKKELDTILASVNDSR